MFLGLKNLTYKNKSKSTLKSRLSQSLVIKKYVPNLITSWKKKQWHFYSPYLISLYHDLITSLASIHLKRSLFLYTLCKILFSIYRMKSKIQKKSLKLFLILNTYDIWQACPCSKDGYQFLSFWWKQKIPINRGENFKYEIRTIFPPFNYSIHTSFF